MMNKYIKSRVQKIEINKELIEVASNKNGMYLIEVN